MVIDDKVIFVHCPRTSGTSIRRALLHGDDPNSEENLQAPGRLNSRRSWKNQKHAYASMIRENVHPVIWDRRFKFSVVRNPWDRMVSLYGLFRKKHQGDKYKINKFMVTLRKVPRFRNKDQKQEFIAHAMDLSFKDWIAFCNKYGWNNCQYLGRRFPMIQVPQSRWFTGLDKVFRFEDREEINEFLLSMGYPIPVPENESKREGDWRSYYDQETYTMIGNYFKEDIERFGYGE
jgi:hypothetical protein